MDIYFNFIGKIELPEDEADEAPAAASPEKRYVPDNSAFLSVGEYLSKLGEATLALPLQRWRSYREEAMRVGFQIRFLLVFRPKTGRYRMLSTTPDIKLTG